MVGTAEIDSDLQQLHVAGEVFVELTGIEQAGVTVNREDGVIALGLTIFDCQNKSPITMWLEWLAESSNERSSAMGRWYLAQLAGGANLEAVALIDLQVSQGENHAAAGLVVFQHPEAGLYQQLVTGRSSCACSTRIGGAAENGRPKGRVDALAAAGTSDRVPKDRLPGG